MANHQQLVEEKYAASLAQAIHACALDLQDPNTVLEERGGWIIGNDDKNEFVQLTNSLTGTPRATHLFVADQVELAKKVFSRFGKEGLKNLATFHTHPQFSPHASQVDWSLLFKCSPVNFIYANEHRILGVYTYLGTEKDEQGNDVELWSQNFFHVSPNDDKSLTFTLLQSKSESSENEQS